MTGTTRGRLRRVYWVRRLMVLGIALLLVVGDRPAARRRQRRRRPADQATQRRRHRVHRRSSADDSRADDRDDPGSRGHDSTRRRAPRPPVTQVAMPSGPCDAERHRDHPVGAAADRRPRHHARARHLQPQHTGLHLDAVAADPGARRSPRGSDLIWTTAQCREGDPDARTSCSARRDPTRVKLTWNARRSEPGCPARTEWALPGTYHLHVAALAGQPQDVHLPADRADPGRGHPDRPPRTSHDRRTSKKHESRQHRPARD